MLNQVQHDVFSGFLLFAISSNFKISTGYIFRIDYLTFGIHLNFEL